jgi:uncharacterized protein YciU (UPF0263 family)
MKLRLTQYAVKNLASDAFWKEANERVAIEHLQLFHDGRGCVYSMDPQPDEWEHIVEFVPDPRMYHEVGYMVADNQQERSLILARVLVSRDEDKPYLYIDWYPTHCDARKRPY